MQPILTAAKKQKKFQKRCKLERDELVIKGKHYNINTVKDLSKSLRPAKVSSQSNDTTYGYFGELYPLSNFHPAPFTYRGISYHCSEQLIQHKKAEYFKDEITTKKILSAKTGFKCKELGRKVSNFKLNKWSKKAKSLCQEGIKQKFIENTEPRNVLLSTKTKTIVECTKDPVWGCSSTLSMDICLDKSMWPNQGIMGKMLEAIRSELCQTSNYIDPNSDTSSTSSENNSEESDIVSESEDSTSDQTS